MKLFLNYDRILKNICSRRRFSMAMWWGYILTGILAGIASGLFGIGGGLVIIPILIFVFGMDQHAANGTSLVALLLPVGAFAVWNYWHAGKINQSHLQAGLWVALGMAAGAYLGSKFAVGLNPQTLRRIFAIFMILAAGKIAFS
jgi:uncharacterized membrane protein YfcA